MLKSIIQQMNLRPESLLRKASRLIPIFPHNHRHLQPPRNQQRLIAEILRQPAGSTSSTPRVFRPYPRESTSK